MRRAAGKAALRLLAEEALQRGARRGAPPAAAAAAAAAARGVRTMPSPAPRWTPPPPAWGRPPRGGGGDPARAVWGLIAANCGVYMLWQSDPAAADRHCVVSLEALRAGRVYTAVTAAFSQRDFGHLASNMVSLFFFGGGLARGFGARTFVALYLAGGVAGSLAHCGWALKREHDATARGVPRWATRAGREGALGASAAVNAVVVVDVLLSPMRTLLLYGIVPMPAALLGALWLVNDVSGVVTGGGSGGVAHAGHLGGAATGLLFYAAFRRGRIRPRGWW
jgi:membrane associated rhomboid family serine protease